MAKAIIMGGGGGGTTSDEVTAKREDVLNGKTAVTSDSNDEAGVGTMPNHGAVAPAALAAGGSYTIPKGYHNGQGKVTASVLSGQTSGTAVAGDILSGKTAWVNGSKVTGSMSNQGAKTASLNAGGSYTIPAGYHNGSGKVTANSLASQTSANATATTIRQGYNAWVNGSKINGSMPQKGAATITPGRSNQSVAANQFLTGAQTILGDANLVAGNIKKGAKIFGVTGTFEGYVPTAQDLYVRGNNIKGFSAVSSNGGPTFSSDCILSGDGSEPLFIKAGSYTRPGGITKLNIECDIDPRYKIEENGTLKGYIGTILYDGYVISTRKQLSSIAVKTASDSTHYKGVITLDISKVSSINTMAILIEADTINGDSKIYRIWVS